ncbi:MAG: anti-sigma factor [Bacteroidia bacterium]|nr:anti-sigma factor [Bacteroidia bacterium]
MDTENYIASGVLESYALGLCSKEEAVEVEKLCKESELIKNELENVQQTLNQYALLYSSAPKQETKTALFKTLGFSESNNISVNLKDPVKANFIKPNIITQSSMTKNIGSEQLNNNNAAAAQAPIIQIQKTATAKYYLVAAVALFIMSLLGNILLFSKWQNTEDALVAINIERSVLANNLKSNQVRLEQLSGDIALIGNQSTQKVMLKGIEKHPDMLATVYWNKESNAVYLEIKKLPMPEKGKQYQLWAMVNGKPMDAGMVTIIEGDSSLHKMKDFSKAQAFAITLEKVGGSTTPDLTQLFVIGSSGS